LYPLAVFALQVLFTAAAPAAQQLLPGFSPQGLINVLWAYAVTLFSVPQDLLDAAAAECMRRQNLAAFGPLNLSMLVWVHAKSNAVLHPSLASAISRAVLATLSDFTPADLCRLLGGFAVMCCVDSQLLAASEPWLLDWIEAGDVNVQDLCHGVWAFAAARSPAADCLIEPLLQLATQHVGVLSRSGQSMARLLSTLVLLRYRADAFMTVLAQRLLIAAAAAPEQVQSLTAARTAAKSVNSGQKGAGNKLMLDYMAGWDTRHIVQLATALAKLGYTQNKPLLLLCIQRFLDKVPSSSPSSKIGSSSSSSRRGGAQYVRVSHNLRQQAVLLLWSAAVLDASSTAALSLLQQLLAVAQARPHQQQQQQSPSSSQQQQQLLPAASLAQLVQVQMWLQVRIVFDVEPPGQLSLQPDGHVS
jgi:hypothetical protein